MGGQLIYEAQDVSIDGVDTDNPTLSYKKDGTEHELICEFIAGCDGFRGISRRAIPEAVLKTHERVYPFGWLGLLWRYQTRFRRVDLCESLAWICAVQHALYGPQPLLHPMRF